MCWTVFKENKNLTFLSLHLEIKITQPSLKIRRCHPRLCITPIGNW
uniref:Uncharacterized protein n=1 Tax=Lepeophtheirus salmonis TaxID=72036 RepID=A0A0K2VGT5_LEPSM